MRFYFDVIDLAVESRLEYVAAVYKEPGLDFISQVEYDVYQVEDVHL